MEVLVTAASKAASKYGATGEIARAIRLVLSEPGVDAAPKGVGNIDDYDAVVLGGEFYPGHWFESATRVVEATRAVAGYDNPPARARDGPRRDRGP